MHPSFNIVCMLLLYRQMLLKALDIVLLILAVLQLFLTVSSAAMSLKALCCRNKQEGKEVRTAWLYNSLINSCKREPVYYCGCRSELCRSYSSTTSLDARP